MVWKLIALGIAGALLGLIAEIFVVQKQYSDNVGMCTSSTVSGRREYFMRLFFFFVSIYLFNCNIKCLSLYKPIQQLN